MGEGKTQHGIYIPESSIFSATTARLNPHRVQERTVLSEDPGMSPGQKCGAVELRLNLSYQRLEAGLNQSRKIPGNQGGVNGNHDCTGFQHNHHKEPPTSSPRTPPPTPTPPGSHCVEMHHGQRRLFGTSPPRQGKHLNSKRSSRECSKHPLVYLG